MPNAAFPPDQQFSHYKKDFLWYINDFSHLRFCDIKCFEILTLSAIIGIKNAEGSRENNPYKIIYYIFRAYTTKVYF